MDTIYNQGIINFSSKSYAFVVLSDSKVIFFQRGGCSFSSIFQLSFVYTQYCIIKEVCCYEVPSISFHTFFVWALLLIVHTWNSSPLWSNLLWLQCTCCTIPTTSGRPHGSPLMWACQWPSSQSLSSPQLSHNDSL